MAPKSVAKRPAASATKEPPSKRHQGPQDVVAAKCKIVNEALLNAPELPETVKEMLVAIVPQSLGVLSEKRHEHQASVVAMLAETLAGVEQGLVEAVREAQSGVDAQAGSAAPLDAAEAAAQAAMEASSARLLERKVASDEAAVALTGARADLEAATAAQASGDATVRADKAQQERIEAVMGGHFASLLGGTATNAKQGTTAVLAVAKELQLDASLITALPTALGKAPDMRGSFDAMTLRTFESEVQKRVEEITARIENAGPAQAERAAVVERATAALDVANAAVVARKEELAASALEGKECKAALKSAQAEVAALQPRVKAAKSAHAKAEASLELFRDGPLATFRELEARSEVKPEVAVPEVVAEPEQSP